MSLGRLTAVELSSERKDERGPKTSTECERSSPPRASPPGEATYPASTVRQTSPTPCRSRHASKKEVPATPAAVPSEG
jgi:hypothetical protein